MSDLVQLTRRRRRRRHDQQPARQRAQPGRARGHHRRRRGRFARTRRSRRIVLIGGGRTFCGGADIKEFGKLTSGQKPLDVGLDPLLSALEDCPKPVVCAIHGTAFGGGLEMAMACHYRVAAPDAQVGQPEVKIGLIPGAGGTQRLPRLAGVAKAAEMCAGGEPVRAADALAAGILDKLIEGDLLPGAVAFAREVAAKGPPRKTRDLTAKLGTPPPTPRSWPPSASRWRRRPAA